MLRCSIDALQRTGSTPSLIEFSRASHLIFLSSLQPEFSAHC